ncbi:MAG: ABC transporter substrate-binding protein [Janthinobacterium lividum]
MLWAGLSATTLALLAACGNDDSGAAAQVASTPIALEPDGDVNYFSWADYVDPDVIKAFESEYGVKVNQSYFDSDEAMLQKIAAGVSYDFVVGNSAYISRMLSANLLREIPVATMKNTGELAAYFKDPTYDKGGKFSLPYGYGPTGIGYNVAAAGSMMTGSWDDLWTAADSDLGGKVFFLDQIEETLGASLLRLGYAIDSADQGEVDKATKALVDVKSSIGGFSTDAHSKLADGTAAVHHCWITDAVLAAKDLGDPTAIGFQLASEGAPVGVDLMTIPAGAKAPGSAALLADWLLAKDNTVKQAQWQGQLVGTTDGDATVEETLAPYTNIKTATDLLDKGKWKESLEGARQKQWTQAWNQVKAG